jgi:predicted TIM-barrel fold metal-dependent hydrolase
MDLGAARKIDCHVHVLDPARFPYAPDVAYRPAGQEIGTAAQLAEVLRVNGTRHALLVQPNSGYGGDNRCMLDAIRARPDLFKGVAIAPMDASRAALADLKSRGVVGIALNPTANGTEHYAGAGALMEKLAELDMFVQLQVEFDQLLAFRPWIEAIPVKVLVDHCGRPTPGDGLAQPGFAALLALAATGRVHVKLSGYAKFSRHSWPFEDARPFVDALLAAFGPERCMWASDWPFLRSSDRQDYGPLLDLAGRLLPDPDVRDAILWRTPARLFGFGDGA